MGTRADFYIKTKKTLAAEDWLGSIAWDGFPKGMPKELLEAKTVNEFKLAVESLAKTREDYTSPSEGWPWPWETSAITDWAYVFDDFKKKVLKKNFDKKYKFPDMTKKQNVQWGKKSGVMILSTKTGEVINEN